MRFEQYTLPAPGLRSLAWHVDGLIDWLGGCRYPLSGPPQPFNVGNSYRLDSAVGFERWGAQYEWLGTKARVMHENGVLPQGGWVPLGVDETREVNRSYYHADHYPYPITLFRLPDDRIALAHCPRGYNVLDLELADGAALTQRPDDNSADFFHSQLQASADGRWLLSNGWVWHPYRAVSVYDVEAALKDPSHLDGGGIPCDFGETWEFEVDGAAVEHGRVYVCAAEDAPVLSVFNLVSRKHERLVQLEEGAGSRIFPITPEHLVAFDGTPRVYEVASGKVVHRFEGLSGGAGVYFPSYQMKPPEPPYLAVDARQRRFALGTKEAITVVTLREA